MLKKCTGIGSAKASGGTKELSHAQLKKISLKESDVAKVTREGISHLSFHPQAPHLLVATGDKQGHIALWDVDKKTEQQVCNSNTGLWLTVLIAWVLQHLLWCH